jgi:hypothetical protein
LLSYHSAHNTLFVNKHNVFVAVPKIVAMYLLQ